MIAHLASLLALAHAGPSSGVDPDGEALVKLLAYRAQVERGAYRETLRLCASYPFARTAVADGPDPGVAWLGVLGHGIAQPLSWLPTHGRAGLKALYNDVNHTRVWHADAWLRSVHVLFLAQSRGFRDAAAKCLGTESPRAIASFAFAITAVDVAGSLLTGQALLIPIDVLLGRLVAASAHVWRRHVPAWVARRGFGYVTWALLPIGAVNLVAYFKQFSQAHRAADAEGNGEVLRRRRDLAARRILMAEALIEYRRALETDDASHFEAWASDAVSATALREAHADDEAIRREVAPTPEDDDYRVILDAILPVLDGLVSHRGPDQRP